MHFNSSYPYPPTILLPALVRVLLGHPSSFAGIAHNLAAGIKPPPRVAGTANIPPEAAFVLIWNHYENARVDAWWGPLVLADAVAAARRNALSELHVLIAREWWTPDPWGRAVKAPLTRWFFRQIAKTYGLIRVPPLAEFGSTRGQGVSGVRQALALTRQRHPELVGLAPEGDTGPGSALKTPPSGVGLFLSLLSHGQIPLLPAAWYEDERHRLVAQFGPPFFLDQAPRALDRRAQDQILITQAMCAIAALLPEPLRGVYR